MIKRTSSWEGILHEVVEHKDTLYLAGLVADDITMGIEGQSESVMQQLDRLLTQHGSDLKHVLQATIFMVRLEQKPDFNAVWKRYIPESHTPGRATIGVADLGPGVLLEMVVTAARKPKRGPRKGD
jgi:enamine deaminase RidA (YjgF/YER057c/UK114 family)